MLDIDIRFGNVNTDINLCKVLFCKLLEVKLPHNLGVFFKREII